MAVITETRSYDLVELSMSDGKRTADIRDMFLQMSIYEDIDLPVITAQLVISDTIGLIELFPIVGVETITLRYSSSVTDKHPYFDRIFTIAKITDFEMTGHRKCGYVLHLRTIPSVHNMNKRIRRSYSDTTSGIVSNICKNMLGIDKLEVEDTYQTRRIVIPNLRPFDAITKMANISLKANSEDKVADYRFFENADGHVFKSLQTLSQGEAIQVLKWYENPVNQLEMDLDKVQSFNYGQMFDQSGNIENGMFANKQRFYNVTTKEYQTYMLNYDDNFKAGTHLDKEAIQLGGGMVASPDANESFLPLSDDYVFDSRKYSVGARLSQTQAFSNYAVTLHTFGNTRQTVGKVVQFNMISIRNSAKVELDEDLSGRYLIFKKKHTLTPGSVMNTIEIRKDCLRN